MAINGISTGAATPYINDYARVRGTDRTQDVTENSGTIRNGEQKDDNDDVNQSDTDYSRYKGREEGLSEAEKKVISELKAADTKVRAHEMAHVAAGGRYTTGGARFTYERGPDGKNYAVAGEVGIDLSEIPGDPEATADKMDVVRRAALAPADPSPQDRRVAARATMIRMEALMDLALLEAKKNAAQGQEDGNFGELSGFKAYSAGDAEPEAGMTINIVG